MKRMIWMASLLVLTTGLLAAGPLVSGNKISAKPQAQAPQDVAALRAKADQLRSQGNWREALAIYERLALDAGNGGEKAAEDLMQAGNCLNHLGEQGRQDALVEGAVAAHPHAVEVLLQAADLYWEAPHFGAMIAGNFERGYQRGGQVKMVGSYERDRVRALQLKVAAEIKGDAKPGSSRHALAEMLMGDSGYAGAWKLQSLTDLSKLPDYEEIPSGYWWGWRRGGSDRGAPVDADGKPVFYAKPASWDQAKNDGERWRFVSSPHDLAQFLQAQFGVQTLAQYGNLFGRGGESDDDTQKDESGVYAVHTLKENETIAKLASGIKRFTLPEEFNYLAIYKELGDWQALAREFENRRQYDRAVECWRKVNQPYAADRIAQILAPWAQFEPIATQPAGGKGASVEWRFRNATSAHFEAQVIDTRKLLDDVKAHIRANPRQIDWNELQISDLGHRLVEQNQAKYLVEKVAAWDQDLKPRPGHWDKRVTVQTPLKKAGAYLLTARTKDGKTEGNLSRVILWVADTALIQKQGDNQQLYFACDAATGQPLAGMNLDFFGYRQDWVNDGDPKRNGAGHHEFKHREFAAQTDADGAYRLAIGERNQYQWLVTAEGGKGRFAYLGFTGVWAQSYQDAAFKQERVFTMTDRPVYRPEQKVQFKLWADQAQYDRDGKSPYAGKQFQVAIYNPKNEKILEKNLTADAFGGFGGELDLPKEAALGIYRIHAWPMNQDATFRVEEYKKPEYEVTVEAPTEPVALGEKITATVKAKYYFGAPVTDAKVSYKVMRHSHSAKWWPCGVWDWYYGPGYWWFAYDCVWYPGWRDWGCKRPVWDWCPWWRVPEPQPEVVLDAEGQLAADGTLKIVIDSAVAKALHGDTDHRYEITAEVVDKSRRTIVGTGQVLVARKPFKVYAWVDKGHYRAGDTVMASFQAQTLDQKPVAGKGELKLLRLSYDQSGKPQEAQVGRWDLATNDQGTATQQLTAARAGQYRLSYTVTDAKGHAIEGGYLFTVMGDAVAGNDYRFNAIEIVPDKREYAPGEQVHLRVNTQRDDATVYLFLKPANGVYLAPQVLRLHGKSAEVALPVEKRDMPNFFVEAVTVADGKVHTDVREIVVPPEKKVLTVEVKAQKEKFKPGEKGTLKVKVTDAQGKPVTGTAAITLYDKSVEYISGGSNVPEIKEFFWKWRRNHYANQQTSLDKRGWNIVKSGETAMQMLGVFGWEVANQDDEWLDSDGAGVKDVGWGRVSKAGGSFIGLEGRVSGGMPMPASTPMAMSAMRENQKSAEKPAEAMPPLIQPTLRSAFADTAYWNGTLTLDANGEAQVEVKMPENLTTWKAKAWALADACRVGEGSAEVVTTKDLIVRLEAPRFFVQKDEVVLSAVVHNYLKTAKKAQVVLALEGGCFEDAADLRQSVEIPAGGEKRVDWRVKVKSPGLAKIRMSALTDEESDATEQTFPVYIHGAPKTESFSRVIRPDQTEAQIQLRVPAERLPEQTRLEVRYSPTLALTMVDALPYLVDYPYGCTEQTLNRFLPTVITQKTLRDMHLDLKAIQQKRTNLNAQEIGDDKQRIEDWKRTASRVHGESKNPVFDEAQVADMTQAGIERLTSMQCADGGWGWFSGTGEQSYPHTTAVVVHGLQLAQACGAKVDAAVVARGVAWLKQYEAHELAQLRLYDETKGAKGKPHADACDALVAMVLADAQSGDKAMRDFLYRDRNELAVYAKAILALTCHTVGDTEKRDMLRRNIDQFLVKDAENQTAYLKLPEGNCWWCWYGSEMEAQAYYLKLLAKVDPKNPAAADLVKYLLNNRRHATYWNSTRDTAVVVEAFADYLKATGEAAPNQTVQVLLDGKVVKETQINQDNLFTFDNKFVIEGANLKDGAHTLTLKKTGSGPLYANAYLSNFTLEDPIAKAGLEIKVERKFYKLVKADKTVKVEGSRGQVVEQKAEKYERYLLPSPFVPLDVLPAPIKSGDLLEVELTIESKNDYEYLCFEDMKAAGCEPVGVQSGYNGNEMGAYVEFRDNRVVFFLRQLARGKHSLSYRLRAETPGHFSALPTQGSAMYAPELRANSDEQKVGITE